MGFSRYILRLFSALLAGLLLFVALAGYLPSPKCRCRSLDKGAGTVALVGRFEEGRRPNASDDDPSLRSALGQVVGARSKSAMWALSRDQDRPLKLVSGVVNTDVSEAAQKDPAQSEAQRPSTQVGNGSHKGDGAKNKEPKRRSSQKGPEGAGPCPFSQLRGLSAGLILGQGGDLAPLPLTSSPIQKNLFYQEITSLDESLKHDARAPPHETI